MYLQHTLGVTHPTLSDVPPELFDDDASSCVSIWAYPTDDHRRASHTVFTLTTHNNGSTLNALSPESSQEVLMTTTSCAQVIYIDYLWVEEWHAVSRHTCLMLYHYILNEMSKAPGRSDSRGKTNKSIQYWRRSSTNSKLKGILRKSAPNVSSRVSTNSDLLKKPKYAIKCQRS